MKNCSVVRDLLPLYADGELSRESDARVRDHLRACPDCRAAARSYGKRVHMNRASDQRARYRYTVVADRVRREKRLRRVMFGAFFLSLGYVFGHLFPMGDDR